MNSFIENVNYVAGLDNLYGSEIELYKNNLSLKSVQHDIELKFSYYSNDDKKIHSIVHSEPGVLVGGINDTLLSFKTLVESSITGSEFTCVVNFVINNIVMVNISIVSNNDMYKAYELEMKIVTAGAVTYDLFGEVSDTLKILPSLASLTSSDIDAMTNVYEIQDEVITVSDSIANVRTVSDNVTSVRTVSDSIANVNTVGNNIGSVNNVSQNMSTINDIADNIVIVSGISTDVTSVADIDDSIVIVADNISSVNTVSSNMSSVNNVSSISNDVVIASGISDDISAIALIDDNVTIVANNIDSVNNVSSNINNVNIVGTDIVNVNKVANIDNDVSAIAQYALDIETVSDNISEVFAAGSNITAIIGVNANKTNINSIVSDVIPNIAEILLSDNNAAIATTKASEASVSAYASLQSALDSAASALSANTSASTSTTKASEASTSATSASASAVVATTKANEASTSASTAATKANEASTSASNVLSGVNKANKWASEAEDVPVEPGEYSAKHWALKAQSFAAGSADTVSYNNNISGLSSTNVKDALDEVVADIALKQNVLISGTNIKTINGNSIVGSGNISTTQTSVSGNAGTATKLETTRTINDVSFDGTANITVSDNTKLTKTNPVITGSITEQVYNLTGTAINPANGTIQYKTVSANTTFTETLTSGQSVLLRLIGASSYTITFPTITWVGAVAPTLTANCAIVLWKEQSTLYGAFVGTLV